MGVLDPTMYAQFKPLFCACVRESYKPEEDWLSDSAIKIELLGSDGLPDEPDDFFLPYIDFFLHEVQQGVTDPYVIFPSASGMSTEPTILLTQPDLFEVQPLTQDATERALIDQLIAATKLYNSGEAIKELFAFTIRLREFAPFNAMLLHIQKPGLTHAATAQDWHKRFGRVPIVGARPLLILRTKGPVDFVFDILDTEGRAVPVDAFAFPTFGNLTDNRFGEFARAIRKERIDIVTLDAGDGRAGWIKLLAASQAKKGKNLYQLAYNKNHDAPTRFVTVAHELAHLYLGHLGADKGRRVPDRRNVSHALMEVEAEMVAYLVAMRNGLKPRSESYLANYKGAFEDLNLYAVTRAANAVETVMGIAAQKLWNEKV
ncbi:ImmA/IrrE family metallo-endopeptidase [Lacimonas salitolerans]|uniref:ImmA/IrrE family metallo-endopeptidase n=1 Tax=Lacimonas salitolerans TaxID=1323750 RepID=A0ABW4EK46_9RHOB